MKIFIVFMGLLVINVSFLSYQGDMNQFVRQQAILKFLAEECAASAAALMDEEEYALGRMVFNHERGEEHVEDFLQYTITAWGLTGQLSCKLDFEDDQMGYPDENPSEIPAVSATIRYETEDLFHLPFITLTQLERKARYQLE